MRTIAARKTSVFKLEIDEAQKFVDENHRQGSVRSASALRAYGLYLEEELLGVALFCNPRTRGMQKKYTTELLRMAFKKDVRIQGGASKLIAHFKRTGAIDLFTYQDLSGESTQVYSLSGMELVSENKQKEILVLNGKTAETARDNRRDWFSLEQVVRFGPDALLKTSIGEVFEGDRRKTNIELFTDLGYHLETVPGDRVYEWRNPEVRFYTYKISSLESDGYYIGRKMYRDPSLSSEDLLLDGYFGSGGKKLKSWLESINPDSIVKEILGMYPDWPSAIKAEYAAIGDSYKDDPNCMNSQPGGMGLGASVANLQRKDCLIHGESVHNGNSCMKCSSSKVFTTQKCSTHGETIFRREECDKCVQFRRYSKRNCDTHGESSHRDNTCLRCSSGDAVTVKKCEIHGFVKHNGEACSTCNSLSGVSIGICASHGETKFRGKTCSKCSVASVVSIKTCPAHGESKHSGNICMKCNSEAQFSVKVCPIHGEVTFKGDTCAVCTANKAVNMKACSIHGVTKHQGDVCNSCNAQKSISQKDCPKHGRTTHQGTVCNRCNAEASISEKNCSKHGLSKFQGDKCVKCRNGSLISERECSVHGPSKHRGATCMKCSQVNRRKPEDVLAEAGFVPADVSNAVAAGEPLTVVAKRFGISKHHVKKFSSAS